MKTEKEKREEEEEDLRPFRIHAYSKEELAMLYNPTYCISNAIYTLAAWIRHNKALKGELEKVGYNKYRRILEQHNSRLTDPLRNRGTCITQ